MQMAKAGFLTRLFASLIDLIITYLFYFVFLGLVGKYLNIFSKSNLAGFSFFIIINLLFGLYFVVFWSTTGQTIGKLIMRQKVVSLDGSKISIKTAAIRWLGYIVSTLPLYLGFLWIIWDKDKQGFHDKIAKTYVIKIKKE